MKGYQPTKGLKNPDPPSGGSGLKDAEEIDEVVVYGIHIQFENNDAVDKWVRNNSHGIFQTGCSRQSSLIEAEVSEDSRIPFRLAEPEYQIENKIVWWKTWKKKIPK